MAEPLGDYVLLRRLAIGGTAEVFEAHRASSPVEPPPYVVKVLLPQLASDPAYVRMLQHEAALNAALVHDNLVRLVELGSARGQPYLVMERVDGIALSDLLASASARGERLPLRVALFIVREVLSGLAYAHSALDDSGNPLGIVHRDVTPHNVLLGKDGSVKLGDFGIARSNVRDSRTRTGVIKGKLCYLAPEQVNGSAVDCRTDVYSVGLVLFELATGERYIRGESEMQILRAAEEPTLRLPSEIAPVDARVDDLVRRALYRFPEERFASSSSFLTAVTEVLESLDAGDARAMLAVLVAQARDEAAPWAKPHVGSQVHGPVLSEPARPISASALDDGGARREQPKEAPTAITGSPKEVGSRARRAIIALGALGAVVAALALAVTSSGSPDADARAVSERARSDRATSARTASDRAGSDQPLPDRASRPPMPEPASVLPVDEPEEPRSVPAAQLAGPRTTGSMLEVPKAPAKPRRAVEARRASSAAEAPAPDEGPAPLLLEPGGIDRALRQRALREGLAILHRSLASRGILASDLSREMRAALAAVDRAAQGDLDEDGLSAAEAELDRAERRGEKITIDSEFVRAKLERVNNAIRAASRAGKNTARVEDLAATALQSFMNGHYDQTNQRLNDILEAL